MKITKSRKVFAVVMALVMTMSMMFATTVSSFAATGNANVKFYVPEKYMDLEGTYQTLGHEGYSLYGQKMDIMAEENVNVYEYAGTVDLSAIKESTVTLPSGFHGLYNNEGDGEYLPTAFDAIYNVAVNQKKEAATQYPTTTGKFVYGFDTPSYTTQGVRADGIFLNKLSGNGTSTMYSDSNTWWGYSWSFYVVPNNASFDPLNPDATYKSDLYTNNVIADKDHTYYMIYEYNEQYW